MIITVEGRHHVRLAPEQGVLNLAAVSSQADRVAAMQQAQQLAQELLAEIAELEQREPSPVASHTAQVPTTWTERREDAEGNALQPVHHVRIPLTVTFTDFALLSAWSSTRGESDGVSLMGAEWRLTDETRRHTEEHALAAAVENARERAAAMARAAGAGEPTLLELADPGLLHGVGGRGVDAGMAGGMMMARHFGGGAIELAPEPIEVSCLVQARFEA